MRGGRGGERPRRCRARGRNARGGGRDAGAWRASASLCSFLSLPLLELDDSQAVSTRSFGLQGVRDGPRPSRGLPWRRDRLRTYSPGHSLRMLAGREQERGRECGRSLRTSCPSAWARHVDIQWIHRGFLGHGIVAHLVLLKSHSGHQIESRNRM